MEREPGSFIEDESGGLTPNLNCHAMAARVAQQAQGSLTSAAEKPADLPEVPEAKLPAKVAKADASALDDPAAGADKGGAL